jgi:hypothetical protein
MLEEIVCVVGYRYGRFFGIGFYLFSLKTWIANRFGTRFMGRFRCFFEETFSLGSFSQS